jgi:hypothetical protein
VSAPPTAAPAGVTGLPAAATAPTRVLNALGVRADLLLHSGGPAGAALVPLPPAESGGGGVSDGGVFVLQPLPPPPPPAPEGALRAGDGRADSGDGSDGFLAPAAPVALLRAAVRGARPAGPLPPAPAPRELFLRLAAVGGDGGSGGGGGGGDGGDATAFYGGQTRTRAVLVEESSGEDSGAPAAVEWGESLVVGLGPLGVATEATVSSDAARRRSRSRGLGPGGGALDTPLSPRPPAAAALAVELWDAAEAGGRGACLARRELRAHGPAASPAAAWAAAAEADGPAGLRLDPVLTAGPAWHVNVCLAMLMSAQRGGSDAAPAGAAANGAAPTNLQWAPLRTPRDFTTKTRGAPRHMQHRRSNSPDDVARAWDPPSSACEMHAKCGTGSIGDWLTETQARNCRRAAGVHGSRSFPESKKACARLQAEILARKKFKGTDKTKHTHT